ncbi:hypothetical protein BKA57DRAFT_487839 [Linnemannia elongata]|nr:hypothetical protein BKA57DRAFT_487839 [Linnemannia elongata]
MWLEQLDLHKPVRVRSSLEEKSEFSSGELVRSASVQLAAEMKKIYWHGSVELLEQLRIQFADENKNANAREDVAASKDADTVGSSSDAEHAAVAKDTASSKDKDIIATKAKDGNNTQSGGFTLAICSSLSTVENFLKFSKLVRDPRRIVPFSHREHGFLSYSERELLVLLSSRSFLQDRIRSWANHTFSSKPSIENLKDIWLDSMEPGFLIKMLLAVVGPKDLTSRQRGKAGYRGAIRLTTMDEIRDHLRPLRQGAVDPREYKSKGYVLRGSIRTDGHRLQILGFKLKELQSCRFKRAC